MRVTLGFGLAMTVGLVNAGCSIGAAGGYLPVSTPVSQGAGTVVAPLPVSYGAFLEGPVGLKLTQADRDKALSAEQDALASGQRRTWKGEHGVFGFVEPAAASALTAVSAPLGEPSPATTGAPSAAGDSCRNFTSTIYLGGRPQVGHGKGCAGPEGTYRIVS